VQCDHVHFLVEAKDNVSLTRGLIGLCVRLARAVNRVVRRKGSLWSDRCHARALRTPREMRHALVYVLMNWLKHVPRAFGIDPCSSGSLFDGWTTPLSTGPPPFDVADEWPIRPAQSWLARTGWKIHGLIRAQDRPKSV
jgi:putative transposase